MIEFWIIFSFIFSGMCLDSIFIPDKSTLYYVGFITIGTISGVVGMLLLNKRG